MVVKGRVENGVVVFSGDVSLPEGAEVTVILRDEGAARADVLSDSERNRIVAIVDRIARLPIEGARDPFTAADHDSVLYGKQ